jgi:hypothetical protein
MFLGQRRDIRKQRRFLRAQTRLILKRSARQLHEHTRPPYRNTLYGQERHCVALLGEVMVFLPATL